MSKHDFTTELRWRHVTVVLEGIASRTGEATLYVTDSDYVTRKAERRTLGENILEPAFRDRQTFA